MRCLFCKFTVDDKTKTFPEHLVKEQGTKQAMFGYYCCGGGMKTSKVRKLRKLAQENFDEERTILMRPRDLYFNYIGVDPDFFKSQNAKGKNG